MSLPSEPTNLSNPAICRLPSVELFNGSFGSDTKAVPILRSTITSLPSDNCEKLIVSVPTPPSRFPLPDELTNRRSSPSASEACSLDISATSLAGEPIAS